MAGSRSKPSLALEGYAPIEAVVRNVIEQLLPNAPSIRAVSRELSINVRTLQRRLAENGLSFRRVLDDQRRQLAEADLATQKHSVAEISRRLGYSDPAHFVRAFRRWTGEAPTRFYARTHAVRESPEARPTETAR